MALTFTATDEKPEWASDAQWNAFKATEAHGSARAAERALGMTNDAIGAPLRRFQKLAALHGYAPGYWDDGVPAGYRLGKVTLQRRNPDGTNRWERLHPEEEQQEAFMARCDDRLKDYVRFKFLKPPKASGGRYDKLTNFLGLFDLHIGEKITSDDPAARWDIATAKRTIKASVDHAISVAPKAKRFVLCFGGDAIHYDGLLPVTPKSRHVLHSDGDFDDMVDAVLDVAIYSIDLALTTHEEVHLIWAEGNHDEASSVWMRKMLARIYIDEPRLSVVQSRIPYYVLQFGQVMIGVHHGHKAKLTRFAGIFANMFRKIWGATTYAYGHRGHEHHLHAKEMDGMVSTQHPALPPSDDYASGLGLVSRRGCLMVTYDDDYGQVCENTTRPEMLGVFDDDERIAA